MAKKAKFAFGNLADVEKALQQNKIDAFDILCLDGATKPKVGWIDKDGVFRLVDSSEELAAMEEYLKSEIEQANLNSTASANAYTDEKLEAALGEYLAKKYEIAYKPEGTLVNYRDKEIRVLCPVDTVWTKQNVGATGDTNKYYMGFKAYAPENAVSFKEDNLATIEDQTMYTFENNAFAGVDENGRKYSIVWLPLATYDNESDVWTYFGASSTAEKYIGWYYSVEWYDANGVMIASDCIRINLSNEDCHAAIEPFYVGNTMQKAVSDANAYTDAKLAEVSGIEIIEF